MNWSELNYDLATAIYWALIPVSAALVWIAWRQYQVSATAETGDRRPQMFALYLGCIHLYGLLNHSLWAPIRTWNPGGWYGSNWLTTLLLVAIVVLLFGTTLGVKLHGDYSPRWAWATLPRLAAGGLMVVMLAFAYIRIY